MATPSIAASPGGREPRPEIVVLKRTVLSLAGVRTPIMQAGEVESAEAVVFVHGNPGSTGDWTRLMERVAPFCRAIAMDMPGIRSGWRSRDDFDYTVDGYRTHLNALLDALSVQRVHLVLHDFGGAWGLAWAARHPQRLASVTLINIGIMRGYRWHLLARIWRTPLLGELFMAMTTRSGLRFATRVPEVPAAFRTRTSRKCFATLMPAPGVRCSGSIEIRVTSTPSANPGRQRSLPCTCLHW